jgi:hypothetical protein
LLVPLYHTYPDAGLQACALPIRFVLAAVVHKPKKKRNQPISAEDQAAYERAKKENTLAKYLVDEMTALRTWMNQQGLTQKTLLMVVDNGYCNQTVFGVRLALVHLLARARKNYRLYHGDPQTEPAEAGFTPEEVRKDPERHWQSVSVQFGGTTVAIRYKEVASVLWPGGAGDRVLRLLVIAGTPYRRRTTAKLQYRDPGYLLTTDLQAPVAFLVPSYFDRWQIEVNHRDEKTVLGVCQAQVRTPQSVQREPAFAVAAYSLLKVAALLALGPTRTEAYGKLPAWYSGSRRPSCEDLVQKLRREAWEHPEWLAPYGMQITPEQLITATRA